MVSVFGLSLLFLTLGATAFTARGLSLTSKRCLTGASGRAVGGLCLGAGLLGVVAAFGFGSSVERQTMKLLSYGIVLGIMATLAVLRGNAD